MRCAQTFESICNCVLIFFAVGFLSDLGTDEDHYNRLIPPLQALQDAFELSSARIRAEQLKKTVHLDIVAVAMKKLLPIMLVSTVMLKCLS